jgi:hypothetical protein
MANCEETICPMNACLGEEGEKVVEDAGSNKACKNLES